MSKESKIGFVVVFIIALFFWGFNFLKGQNVFESNSRIFYIEYNNIQGLKKASSVFINGLAVGKVSDIRFNQSEGKKGSLVVEITLDNDFPFSKNSVAKIYSSSLLGGQSLAIIPNYEGDIAVSKDTLKGEVESDIFSTVGEKLNPLQAKLENVIVSADSLFLGVNQILNKKTRESLNTSVKNLEYTIAGVKETVRSVNRLLDSSSVDLKETVRNTKYITENLSKVSDTLANANIGGIIRKAELTLVSVNSLLAGIDQGKGSIGKLVNDDAMYINLTNVSKELEELLREMKLNPKRFVHFSLFGKKAKAYEPNTIKVDTTNIE
jgi:phospholipid/cholesterol/gamma-HCH transport system substrate-binding protein